MADDARSLPNTALLETSFLYGANALFVEEMHARFLNDPNSVDPSWRAFFQQLRDNPEAVRAGVAGPSWFRPELAQPKSTEITRLLDADWGGLTQYGSENTELRLRPGEDRVVFLGDEITENWGKGKAKFFPGKPYLNRGILRQTSAHWRS